MSKSIPAAASAETIRNPFQNPSYPQRVHLTERTALRASLESCDVQLATFRQKLDVLEGSADRPSYERLFLQLQGARDQVADCVRRMPLEAGSLYEEDHERLQAALEAFGRIAKRWSA